MDPWSNCQYTINVPNNVPTKFEDNFIPVFYEKLPDHEKYLAALESKLQKLRSNPHVLKQLTAKKEFYMRQLLTEDSTPIALSSLETPIPDSPILRSILPQKQAIHEGELVEFIKYDQLSTEKEHSNNQDELNSERN
ncbi:hypothetical protein ABEB36_008576 [Hypothenemus hampei]|uniref:Uncharacterized protein n=1 Tax=Hypothenemus hampei TaxID=57062 RepID=A0ABD1EMC9_HYPHA